MHTSADKLVDAFVAMLNSRGVPIRPEDNVLRLRDLEESLPKRLPPSFEYLLSRYSFPTFDVFGITLFDWDSESNRHLAEASAYQNSLSELLIPAGFVQIGRPDTGDFDAVCFDLNDNGQDRECRLVQVDHEAILRNWKVRVTAELWPSFIEFVGIALSSADPRVYYESQIQ